MITRFDTMAVCLGAIVMLFGCERDEHAPASPAEQVAHDAGESPTTPPAEVETVQPASQPQPPTLPPANRIPPTDPRLAEFCGLIGAKPATWIWHPPQQPGRVVNWMLPGGQGGGLAELVVTHFPGEGGTVDANIQRWISQFRFSESMPAIPAIEKTTIDGMSMTIVEIAGDQLTVGAGRFVEDRMLVAAVIETPVGLVFLKLSGPTLTVARHRQAFREFLKGIRREGSPPEIGWNRPLAWNETGTA